MLAASLMSACTRGTTSDSGDPSTTGQTPTTLQPPTGKLTGMQGTTPRSVSTGTFDERLKEVAPALIDTSYAAEAYDSVVVVGLAVEVAHSDAPGRFTNEIPGVTSDGARCTGWLSCQELAARPANIDYDGVSGGIEMQATGVPGEGSFAVMKFDQNDKLVRQSIESAQAPPPTVQVPMVDPTLGPPADGELKIGMLLPTRGSNAALGAAERAGVRLAVKEINAAGGVLGRPITLVDGDESSDLTSTAATLLSKGVDAIVGPATSDDVAPIVDQVTGAGVVLISPSASSGSLTSLLDHGRFFQMSPSDALQGQVLADVAAGDGITSAVVMAQKGTYGQGAAFDFAQAFKAKGGTVASVITFDPNSLDPNAVSAALATKSTAMVLFGDNQPVGQIITSLSTAGKGPDQMPYYMGNISAALPQFVH
jgi:ABC-type branched-subunit amino acid transport system substrate-binding protein